MRSEGAADVCITASACSDDLRVLAKMLGASVLVSPGASLSQPSAGANSGQTSAAPSERLTWLAPSVDGKELGIGAASGYFRQREIKL